MQELFTIEEMNVSDVERLLFEAKEEVDVLNNSRLAFKTAESFFANKNYPEAMTHYRQVIEADGNYETATKKLSDAENMYRQETLNQAAEYAAKMLYSEAILELDTGLQNLPDDADLVAQKKVYEADYAEQLCAEALTEAEEYAQAADYTNAVKVIQHALENVSENAKLKAAYQKYSDAYVADEIAKADKLIADYDFDGAIAILKDALKILPEDSKLADKLQLIETNKPIALTSIHVVDSLFYETGSGSDTFGNSYDNTISVGSYNLRSGYVIYNLNGKYDTLQFSIAASSNINGWKYDDPDEIKVYADDVLIYAKKLDLTTPPETVTLKILDCKVLKIERGDARNKGNRLPLIADPIVFKINMG